MFTIINSDEILVLDDGHVVEHGTPADLLAANGEFAALVASAHDGALYDQISQKSDSPAPTNATITTTRIGPSPAISPMISSSVF